MEILKDFGFDARLLVAQIVNFLILLFLLYKLAYKNILAMLEERKNRIAESMEQAKQIEERFAKLDQEQAEMLKKAQAQADGVLASAKESAAAIAMQAQVDAKAQTEKILARAKESAQVQYEQMHQRLRHEVVSLAIVAAEKATGGILTAGQKESLTKEAIKEMQAS